MLVSERANGDVIFEVKTSKPASSQPGIRLRTRGCLWIDGPINKINGKLRNPQANMVVYGMFMGFSSHLTTI